MVRNIFLVVFAMLAFNLGAANIVEGQSKSEVSATTASEDFEPRWFVSAAVGPQVLFGDHNKQMGFGDRLSPSLDIAVGRWFSPVFGARVMYSGLFLKGATQNGAHANGEFSSDLSGAPYWLQKQKINYFSFHADALVNVTNWWMGYNTDRVWDCSPYVGIGLMCVTEEPSATKLAGHFGLFNAFHINSALDLNVDLRGTVTGDSFDGEEGERSGEGILTLNFGVTYHF